MAENSDHSKAGKEELQIAENYWHKFTAASTYCIIAIIGVLIIMALTLV